MTPRARQDGLLSETVENELVVYDIERHKAHRLNRTAALVWRHANGERSVADMAALLQQELGPVADEDLVWCTLDRLSAAHLMAEPGRRPVETARASRRQFVRKVGLVGTLTLLLPAVTSIVAPTPAEAQSCIICETISQICSTDSV
jgi:hypothetical protein